MNGRSQTRREDTTTTATLLADGRGQKEAVEPREESPVYGSPRKRSQPGGLTSVNEVDSEAKVDRTLTLVIVLYVLLWGFDGAIRKWVPGTEAIFYVFRDAALLAVFLLMHIKGGLRRRATPWFWVFGFVLALLAMVQIIADLTSPIVAAVGLRSYLAPLLLLAVVVSRPIAGLAQRMSIAVCVVAIVNLPITIAQVISPKDSPINGQVGSDAAYFVNPGGVVRASGTFSAPAGHTLLMPLALLAGLALLESRRGSKPLGGATIVATLVTTSLSGSRAAVVYCAFVAAAYVYVQIVKSSLRRLSTVITIGAITYAAIYLAFVLFPTVLDSFTRRVETAGESEDVNARLFTGIAEVASRPFTLLGQGVGAYGVTAARLGVNVSEAVESDMGRWLVELGLLGFLMALARIAIGALLVVAILVRGRKWPVAQSLAAAAIAAVLLGGSVTQIPTSQGFFAIVASMFVLHSLEGSGELSTDPPRVNRNFRKRASVR